MNDDPLDPRRLHDDLPRKPDHAGTEGDGGTQEDTVAGPGWRDTWLRRTGLDRLDWEAWQDHYRRLREAVLRPQVDEAALAASLREARARMPVPVVWLVGKTQAGKTSIIRALTGSERAEIGNGFQPCTRSAQLYDFPAEMPVVRFLDTRGLGEVDYDPGEDIAYCEARAHLLLAVMKVADPRQEAVAGLLRTVRERHPDWPLVIAQTGLHERYPPGAGHVQPYPFDEQGNATGLPADLARALSAQRDLVGRLPGAAPVRWVAVDLTLPEDGYVPDDYGRDALWQAIEAASSLDLRRQLLDDARVRDVYARAAHPHIVGHTLAAAGLGALPVIDLVAVSAVQAKLLHAIARLHGQRWDGRMVSEFVGLLGAGVATGLVGRMLGRSVAKLIPGWGQTVGAVWGASTSGAATYALGKAAVYFLGARHSGAEVDGEKVREIYAEALGAGRRLLATQAGSSAAAPGRGDGESGRDHPPPAAPGARKDGGTPW